MKVIQIQDEDALALLDKLKTIKARCFREGDLEAIHRAYWHAVVSWLQQHGVDTVSR